MKFSESDQFLIDSILVNRFYGSISIYHVLNWLDNFDKEDLPEALKVLENIEYLPLGRVLDIYSDGLSKVFKQYSNKIVIVLGIGKYGKSGSSMLYFINKSPTFSDKRYRRKKHLIGRKEEIIPLIQDLTIVKDDFLLLLVDDFVGTGNSVGEFLSGNTTQSGLIQFLADNQLKPNLAIVSIIINEEGFEMLQYSYPNVGLFGEVRKKAFSQPSVFGYRPNTLPVREFCYKYGAKLVTEKKNALGYENSQSLVVFEHTTPNNTLPIIWSSRCNWTPLFPRFYSDFVKNHNELKKEILYWVSISKNKFEIPGLNLSSTPFSKRNLEMFAVMKLLKAKRSDYVICQWLNISTSRFETLLTELVDLKLCTSHKKLSSNGVAIVNEIEKFVYLKNKKSADSVSISPKKIVYLPKTFGDKT
ncbi:phosphoribosyltransferase-like protein [Sphingobacterium multivorum]|uniref:Uncharacterized protein n=1 Tax=Sphingobacterium multivorum TaxID=28454 RepID=A0A2X2LT22_SPHMU|nr:hypothetical protein [Sphingobacterium multivorum]QQT46929.1 hypothetical protein I6J00_09845 [Sphingobacterium multivorum]QRQ62373.1 hypothetical protein I6J33_05155 [Sphingobacterium multivorum]SPZ92660.1 Uncharacterised protein [Sphingobacterium multivorum]SUJ88741.1 Uncharacterised protein [Sphingobacterium multivorum]